MVEILFSTTTLETLRWLTWFQVSSELEDRLYNQIDTYVLECNLNISDHPNALHVRTARVWGLTQNYVIIIYIIMAD